MCGVLGYMFLFNNGWEYILLTISILGLLWSVLLKWLSEAYEKKVFYRLIDTGHRKNSNDAISVDLEREEASCVEIPWRLLLKQKPIL